MRGTIIARVTKVAPEIESWKRRSTIRVWREIGEMMYQLSFASVPIVCTRKPLFISRTERGKNGRRWRREKPNGERLGREGLS